MCVCTKERKGVAAAVLMATPCTNGLHRESVSGEAGFRLGFVYRCAGRVGSGLYQSASILYHLTTARRWRSGDTQRFVVLYSKFEFAVQDAIKTPKLKPHRPERRLLM